MPQERERRSLSLRLPELLVKAQIKRLKDQRQYRSVYDELKRCFSVRAGRHRRFSQLRDAIVDVVNTMLRDRVVPTQKMVSDLSHRTCAHQHEPPGLYGGSRAVSDPWQDAFGAGC